MAAISYVAGSKGLWGRVRRVNVEITPISDEPDAVDVYAPGFFIDAVRPCLFGGYRAYARGRQMFCGRPAFASIPEAIHFALNCN